MYFLYPETCGVRLEDMDALFGDSTRALGTPAAGPTPAMRAESDALLRPASPAPPLDNRGVASSAIPGLDINPPDDVEADGKRGGNRRGAASGGDGLGGWLSRIMRRGGGSSRGAEYAPVGQGED